ncbi:unnamed protein product [Caenorhabditis auriculariae]|uniref:Uncharacterized protein n=1 Tax=Caenorhabditis auriculariae TaxID=2777116 RepID=A0A8S1H6J2_9PELO|nr:unnamed protein product [Caenorhabditis auriculariae]
MERRLRRALDNGAPETPWMRQPIWPRLSDFLAMINSVLILLQDADGIWCPGGSWVQTMMEPQRPGRVRLGELDLTTLSGWEKKYFRADLLHETLKRMLAYMRPASHQRQGLQHPIDLQLTETRCGPSPQRGLCIQGQISTFRCVFFIIIEMITQLTDPRS